MISWLRKLLNKGYTEKGNIVEYNFEELEILRILSDFLIYDRKIFNTDNVEIVHINFPSDKKSLQFTIKTIDKTPPPPPPDPILPVIQNEIKSDIAPSSSSVN